MVIPKVTSEHILNFQVDVTVPLLHLITLEEQTWDTGGYVLKDVYKSPLFGELHLIFVQLSICTLRLSTSMWSSFTGMLP